MAFILSQPVEPFSPTIPPSNALDLTHSFQLIDRILPFEACLYHEFVPLFLENRMLRLGMVTLTDALALDYARKILRFLNYGLTLQVISIDLHRQMLSQYLQFKEQADLHEEEQTVFYELDKCERLELPTVQASSHVSSHLPVDRKTLIVETPETIDDWRVDRVNPTTQASSSQVVSPIAPLYGNPLQGRSPLDRQSVDNSTLIQSHNPLGKSPSHSVTADVPFRSTSLLPTPGDARLILSIKTTYADAPLEVLQGLDSTELLENLLGRVLKSGIGRLYFEYQSDSGRVLSSTNGILQPLIESFPIARFESLIWALKNLMKVSPEPVTEPVQVEIERWHDKNHLLLRLRLMPQWEGEDVVGEDATLQVLRGAALRFYQQQQRTNLRRDTLLVAKNLQLKVQALQERSNPIADSPP